MMTHVRIGPRKASAAGLIVTSCKTQVGPPGNGYALLRTFGRTADERWLDRARRFAVHALDQVERWREIRGTGRYSLWTGDLGAAVYASDCLDSRTEVPIVDYL